MGLGNGENILVAAAAQTNDDDVIPRQFGRNLRHMGHRMGGFQRRYDALEPGQKLESVQGFVVSNRRVFGASRLIKPGVLRSDPGVIEAGGNRMGLQNLAVKT